VRLQNRTALVTGGASGIGEAICHAFARDGARVAILDLDLGRAEHVASGISEKFDQCIAVQADVSDAESVNAAVADAAGRLGGLEILVNNAGIRIVRPFMDHTAEDFQQQLGVNLIGAFNCSKAAVPYMKRNGRGKIINLASIASFMGRPDRAAYCATKAGLLGLTRSAAIDLRGYNICVNCIAPGMIATPFNAHHSDDAEIGPRWAKENPAGRWGQPADIANAAVFLASPESDFVNGADLKVDGAWLAFKARSGELEGET